MSELEEFGSGSASVPSPWPGIPLCCVCKIVIYNRGAGGGGEIIAVKTAETVNNNTTPTLAFPPVFSPRWTQTLSSPPRLRTFPARLPLRR